jgi:hypothetical protein
MKKRGTTTRCSLAIAKFVAEIGEGASRMTTRCSLAVHVGLPGLLRLSVPRTHVLQVVPNLQHLHSRPGRAARCHRIRNRLLSFSATRRAYLAKRILATVYWKGKIVCRLCSSWERMEVALKVRMHSKDSQLRARKWLAWVGLAYRSLALPVPSVHEPSSPKR